MGNQTSKSIAEPKVAHPDVYTILDIRAATPFGSVERLVVAAQGDEKANFDLPIVPPLSAPSFPAPIGMSTNDEEAREAVEFFCFAHREQAPAETVSMQEISPVFGQGSMAPHKKCQVPFGEMFMVFRKRAVRIIFGPKGSSSIGLFVLPLDSSVPKMKQRKECQEFVLNFMGVMFEYFNAHVMNMPDAVRIYTNCGDSWERLNNSKPRPMSTVCLPRGQKEALVEDITNFRLNMNKLQKLGLPCKRGYLLSGVPGTGKTSLLTALAGHFKFKLCMLSLAEKNINDTTLPRLIQNMPDDSALVIEDIDRMTLAAADDVKEPCTKKHKTNQQAEQKQQQQHRGVSMSCLLSALDGVYSDTGGQIVFFTTNNPDVLDEALLRPGRVDYHLKMQYADRFQMEAICGIFWPDSPEIVRKMVSLFPEEPHKITAAAIMSRLVSFMAVPVEQVLALEKIVW